MAPRDAERSALDERVLAWMRSRAWVGGKADDPDEAEARFDALALDLFAYQFENCAPYKRYCSSLGATPVEVANWRQVPAVPTGAFKELRLATFEETRTQKVFRSSGTSSERRSEVHLDRLDLYEASLEATLRALFFTGPGTERICLRILAPAAAALPDSSLSHMFAHAIEVFGDEESGFDFRDQSGVFQLDLQSLEDALRKARDDTRPMAICGTSFAFVHLLDALAGRSLGPLPRGSIAMETGGFKGRSRSVPRAELRAGIARCLGLDEKAVINQYGMSELGSQFYDSTRVDPQGPRRKLGAPWTRVRIVDPLTQKEVAGDEVGMIVIHDLANTGSVAALQSADLGRWVDAPGPFGRGFDVLGRAEGAEERGCSIAADTMLGGEGGPTE